MNERQMDEFIRYIEQLRAAAGQSRAEAFSKAPPKLEIKIIGLDLSAITDNELIRRIANQMQMSEEVKELIKRYLKLAR